jgi:molybdopterin molybdotransferase
VALLPVADALAKILQHADPLPTETVPLEEAHGRVLAQDLAAQRTQPPDDVSAMDGYAARAADVATAGARLRVIGEVAAGHPFNRPVSAGEAARIFTGGVVPKGADTIVVQEDVTGDGGEAVVGVASAAGRHIRRAGIDFKQGAVLLAKGQKLTGRDVMLAAAMNHPTLLVHRRPKVAVLATGDELVLPGETPGPGQIVYSNGYSVMALARAEGAEVSNLGVAKDRLDAIIAAMRKAKELGADVLVTTGGASVGEHDLMQQALAAEGVALSFWKVALRPGRPVMHGRADAMHVLGLPGNPVSSFVCSVLFLGPLLRKLSGRSDIETATESAALGSALRANDERADYLRATLTPGADGGLPVATPVPSQDSSLMAPLARADCLIIRAPLAPAAQPGEACLIVKLPL